mmetsp:Transcript_22289/g.32211  ORF Transcript_22289/g.32211 Transcript_22289/m.32211 type:complete len:326 (-) Transcript_22289:97-1074(-)|eukprot:CAMPEP_0184750646 /NCGR_PEP_ID=MMETSP0315-20130426/37909_1 /TAXON_ID=101924 /ORGANISM="Rhodosorus marinus, Strain UTEX LB 2760" /LENGTH=325 /DNA_ID=CAMNT_0027229097 /DNA_START=394 /DNA_END=1371 /DNA_ORIENTATION=-
MRAFLLFCVLSLAFLSVACALKTQTDTFPVFIKDGPTKKIKLPRGRQPEGVTAGPKKKLLVGSFSGDIVEVGVPKEKTKVLLNIGMPMLGLYYWANKAMIFANGVDPVNGGGTIFAIDYSTRSIIQTCVFPGALPNDQVVDDGEKALYITDSMAPTLWKLSLEKLEKCKFEAFPLDDLPFTPGAFNSNGIVRYAGKSLIASTEAAQVWSFDENTMKSKLVIDRVPTADGMALIRRKGRDFLFVVKNGFNVIKIFELRKSGSSVKAIRRGRINNKTFRTPTTADIVGDYICACNARFAEIAPGTPESATKKFDVTCTDISQLFTTK